ncbi:hypothetical protein MIR68_006527 [Amoeboaphelidium protococcarum]|nr:hypothetical protein MIR68_006527 [Amoeboaphelidium protococcarum]
MYIILLLLLVIQSWVPCKAEYMVGVGIHDVTGPIGGVNMMGYAMVDQISQGILTRLRARAFIFEQCYANATYQSLLKTGHHHQSQCNRVVYVSVDSAMISQNVKAHVIQKLHQNGYVQYKQQNVLLSATHTHSSAAGFHEYLLYDITSMGYVRESELALVDGIYGAIVRAHHNIKASSIRINKGRLDGANINRSPTAYLANRAELRAQYAEDGDTEKTMTTLNIQDSLSRSPRGAIAFFSVHGTSMNNTNRLLNGDNKGYASWLLEKEMNNNYNVQDQYLPYTHPKVHKSVKSGDYFVAAFGQVQEGDVSPNIYGAFCLDTGLPCDKHHSTCPDKKGRPRNKMCHARGPGFNSSDGDVESTRIIGLRQYLKARDLLKDASNSAQEVSGSVDYAHAWVDMSKVNVNLSLLNHTTHREIIVSTCKPARGYSFASGTSDGPGEFDFIQGDNSTGTPFWNFIKQFISKPSEEQVKCHYPKPILLNTGEIKKPYLWEPQIVDIQILKIGNLVLLGVPGEFTTMAGRLLRSAVRDIFVHSGIIAESDISVIIAGLSNSYSGYVTTFEEYQVQRYEGASTIYGPHALDAYIQEFSRLAYQMAQKYNSNVQTPVFPAVTHDPTVPPVDFTDKLLTFLPAVIFDAVPPLSSFGSVSQDVESLQPYHIGDVVNSTFYAGHPRNVAQNSEWQLEGSFASVEKWAGPSMDLIRFEVEKFGSVLIQQVMGRDIVFSVQWVPDSDCYFMKYDLNLQFNDNNQQQQLVIQDENVEMTTENQKFTVYAYVSNGELHLSEFQPTADIVKDLKQLWIRVRDDDDWDLKMKWWKPVAGVSAISYAQLIWKISDRPDQDVVTTRLLTSDHDMSAFNPPTPSAAGTYRLKYEGAHKSIFGQIRKHTGVSSFFVVY